MRSLPPLTLTRFVADWRFDGWVMSVLTVMVLAYLAGVIGLHRRGGGWPAYRVTGFLIVGAVPAVIATMSSVAIYARVLLWPAALQVLLLLTVVPIGIGLGEPLSLISALRGGPANDRWDRLLHSRVVRVLTFPAVAPVLAVCTQLVVLFTSYLGDAERHATILHLLELQLVVTGCLFALPLIGVELLPPWCTQPIRMAFAALDGLLDAIPGIAVMTSSGLVAAGYYGTVSRPWGPSRHWDQTIAGGLMLTIAEVVAVPFVAILFRAWIREDAAIAINIDRRLDETIPSLDDQAGDRPWWEVDAGPLADRARRYGWTDHE